MGWIVDERKLVRELEEAVARLLGHPTVKDVMEELGRKYRVEVSIQLKEKTNVEED